MKSNPFATMEDEYTPKYCLQLETAYGDGMMSEGGHEGIEDMFDQIPLAGKRALDIGSGLGGVVFYLAEKYRMRVTGLEVNPWMVEESNRRIPNALKDKVEFILSTSNHNWPKPDASFDIIYSKGVLTHVQTKKEIFQECHRLLKHNGLIVITDWLSAEEKKWGKNMARLIELEKLVLHPENESGYIQHLEANGFSVESIRDESPKFLSHNLSIVKRLSDPLRREVLLNVFSQEELANAIDGYESIVKAFQIGELRTLRFVGRKS